MPQPARRKVFQGEVFRNTTVRLDGKRFERCAFIGCILEYAGKSGVEFDPFTTTDECRWTFVEDAGRAVDVLVKMFQVPGLRSVPEDVMMLIRGETPPNRHKHHHDA
jgi:hypothetical protein